MNQRTLAIIAIIILVIVILATLGGCSTRQSTRVSYNLSKQADSFNVTRRLTVINTRAEDGNDAILYQMTGNFSIEKELDGDLEVIGENPDGTYYKHFVCLTRDVSYITEQLTGKDVSKHKFTINYNPKMIVPVNIEPID